MKINISLHSATIHFAVAWLFSWIDLCQGFLPQEFGNVLHQEMKTVKQTDSDVQTVLQFVTQYARKRYPWSVPRSVSQHPSLSHLRKKILVYTHDGSAPLFFDDSVTDRTGNQYGISRFITLGTIFSFLLSWQETMIKFCHNFTVSVYPKDHINIYTHTFFLQNINTTNQKESHTRYMFPKVGESYFKYFTEGEKVGEFSYLTDFPEVETGDIYSTDSLESNKNNNAFTSKTFFNNPKGEVKVMTYNIWNMNSKTTKAGGYTERMLRLKQATIHVINMSHVCTEKEQELNNEGQPLLIQFIADVFKCGGCEKNFARICSLHEHLKNHSSGGSYYYDHVSKTVFPKLDLMCTATQTEWEREGNMIAPLDSDIIVKTEIHNWINNSLLEKQSCFALNDKNSNSDDGPDNGQVDSFETFERLHQIKYITDKSLNNSESVDYISCYLIPGKSESHNQRDASDSENTITDYWYTISELDHMEETRKRKLNEVRELDKSTDNKRKKQNACLDTVRAKDGIESLQFECGEELPALDDVVSIKVEEGVKGKKGRPIRTSRYPSTERKSDGKKSRVKKIQRKNTITFVSTKISFKNEMKPLTDKVLDTRKNYHCEHCGKVYSTLPGLQYHNEAIHLKARVKCSVCDKEMATKYSLRNHMIEVHKLGARTFKCDKCDRFFPYQYRLRDHMKLSHTTDKDLEACLVCEQCGMKFLTRQRFTHHINAGCLHNRVRKYPCPDKECQFVAFTSRGLSKHVEKHRPEDKYTCHICGAGFKHYHSSVNHQLVHTDKRDFACKHCNKAFKSAMALRRHVFIHENNTRYKCKYCERQFVQKSNLDAHLRQHTGVKPYKCDYCSEAFAHNVSRKNHMTKCRMKPLPYVSILPVDSKM